MNLHSDHQGWGAVLLRPFLDSNISLTAFVAHELAAGVKLPYKTLNSVIKKTLASIYLDPSQPESFGGLGAVYRAVKDKGKNKISRKQGRDWLSQQDVYTLHKLEQRHYKRTRVIFPRIDAQLQADLVDLQNLGRYNKGYKNVLACIVTLGGYT